MEARGLKPLVVDLCCGRGGWARGFIAQGWRAVGFDVERHTYPGELALQDIRTLDGRQLRQAAAIVASPPCTEYSYMAMPWKRGKQIAAALMSKDVFPANYAGSKTVEELRGLFDNCFRIQREASEAAGRYIPMIVENVKGAQPWVGKAVAHYGSFYLWGDVPALLPRARMANGEKVIGRKNRRDGHAHTPHLTNPNEHGVKQAGLSGERWFNEGAAAYSSGSKERKLMAAVIAQIPPDLAEFVATCFKPTL